VVLYFYPKDMTPGCTVEACAFQTAEEKLRKLGAVVLGVSMDSTKSHKKFAQRHHLSFPLLSDEEGTMVRAYGAYGEKKFMGRTYNGTYRNTYLINPEGVIKKVYEGVKVKGHEAEVITDLEHLKVCGEVEEVKEV
jgi:thioredoxin-dependent peroxiredoxin